VSLVVFPVKDEDLSVVSTNLATAAGHERIVEVWAVAAGNATIAYLSDVAAGIASSTARSIAVFPQERLGAYRSGKGDAMNTAIARAAERGFDRVHFYDADITNFDESWIDGAERAADRGFDVVRHRFPRAATDAMITWMVTRPGLAMLFPGTVLPRLGQPLGGEMLLTGDVLESLAGDPFVIARSDWGIDTIITHATSTLGVGLYEHNAPDGKRHALYGALTDIRDMVLECLDAVASLRGRRRPNGGFESDPAAPVPEDLKETVAYDMAATRAAIADLPGPEEAEVLDALGLTESVEMDAERWLEIFPALLAGFRLDDAAWRSAVFRLWVERVVHYTTHQVPLGYDAAMTYLQKTVTDFEVCASRIS
jgi:mannosylglycerate synthase